MAKSNHYAHTIAKCLEKEMMHPLPKQGSTKRVLNAKNIQLLLSICSSCRSLCQYCNRGSSGWLCELLWVVPPQKQKITLYSVYKQSSQFLLQRMLLKILPVIVSDLLQHLQVTLRVNFYHYLGKYITKLHGFIFTLDRLFLNLFFFFFA